MCPIWPLHLIILYLLALCSMWVPCQAWWVPTLNASFIPADVTFNVDDEESVNVTVEFTRSYWFKEDEFLVSSLNNTTATARWIATDTWSWRKRHTMIYQGVFRVTGHSDDRKPVVGTLPVNVVGPPVKKRKKKRISLKPLLPIGSTFCAASVGLFVALNFLFFGCAMDLSSVREVLCRRVGLLIGLVVQFLFLPLILYWLAPVIFPDSSDMRVSMFFTGLSPACGTANIWTFLLRGNINLSLVMTCISMFVSFVFMPTWLFFIGPAVIGEADVGLPYQSIATYSVWLLLVLLLGFIVPLAIGFCLRVWMPRLAACLLRILNKFWMALLLFFLLLLLSTILTIVTNMHVPELFIREVLIAGMCIPWLCFLFGYILMTIFMQSHRDALAIAIVTGLLNNNVPVLLLRYALSQTDFELMSVVPLAVIIMAPIPLMLIVIFAAIVASCQRVFPNYQPLPPGILHKLPLQPVPGSVAIYA